MNDGPDGEGVRLAARWRIERVRRPAGAGLVWLGFAKPEVADFECLACGDAATKQGVVRAHGRTLFLCGACASHQFFPPDPPEPQPSAWQRRLRWEYAADWIEVAGTAARALAGRSGGALLDLRDGEHGVVGGDFDVILCEGVLEISADPQALLRRLPAVSRPHPRWLIATADVATLYDSGDPEAVLRLTAPPCRLVLSQVGLRRLLDRGGLLEGWTPQIVAHDGTLRADRDPPAAAGCVDTMLDAGVIFPEASAWRGGLVLHALVRAVNAASWDGARLLVQRLAQQTAAAAEAARAAPRAGSIEQLFAHAPIGGASLLYHVGMLHLNGSGASTQALVCFELAEALAHRAATLEPALMAAEHDRRHASRFHAALVRARLGEVSAAMAAFEELGNDRDAAATIWPARARAELASLDQRPPLDKIAPAAAPRPRRAARAGQAG